MTKMQRIQKVRGFKHGLDFHTANFCAYMGMRAMATAAKSRIRRNGYKTNAAQSVISFQ